MAMNPTVTERNPETSTKPSVYLEDMDELKRVFNRFDTNDDGKISVDELDNILCTLGSRVPPEELKRIMEGLDTDHDGFFNLSEFVAFCRSGTTDGGASELRNAFDLYIQDKNDLISATDIPGFRRFRFKTRVTVFCSHVLLHIQNLDLGIRMRV